MRRVSLFSAAGILFSIVLTTNASAQVARVFLAGTGNDAGDCTNQATPCRSLQGAVTACPVNGEIIILDNGGYGGATITKSLTVNASAGIVAFIARTITVNIASADKVVLRGLSMNGVVFADTIGIAFTGGGTLIVENSVIAGFLSHFTIGAGIDQSAAGSNLIVNNCEFRNNAIGVRSDYGASANTTLENSRFESNFDGVAGASGSNISIRNSVFSNNTGTGVIGESYTATLPTLIVVDTCTIAHNARGILANVLPSGSAVVRVTNSTIYHNTNGMGTDGGPAAVIESYGNNRVLANTSNSTFSGTVLPMQ